MFSGVRAFICILGPVNNVQCQVFVHLFAVSFVATVSACVFALFMQGADEMDKSAGEGQVKWTKALENAPPRTLLTRV